MRGTKCGTLGGTIVPAGQVLRGTKGTPPKGGVSRPSRLPQLSGMSLSPRQHNQHGKRREWE